MYYTTFEPLNFIFQNAVGLSSNSSATKKKKKAKNKTKQNAVGF
jgi:hypothetical protein